MAKILKFGSIVILLIVVILILVPWLFKDEIFKKVKEEANNNLKGELFIEDLSLSLFRDFPNLSLTLEKVRYECDTPFAGIELFNIEELRAELDLMSVISGDAIDIKKIAFDHPTVHVKVLKNGNANYLIMKESEVAVEEESAETAPFKMGIERFTISNLNLVYDDAEGEIFTEIVEGNFILNGDFTESDVVIKTMTTMKEFTVGMSGLNYLNKVALMADVAANYNQESALLTLTENTVEINKLRLLFNGWVQSFDDKMALDLTYEAPHSEFKEILSLVPAVYMEGYESVQTSGTFSLKGDVKGDYFYEGEDLPEFNLTIDISDGNFKYPDLPSSVSAIEMKMAISHPQGDADKTIVDISKSSMQIAGSPFKAKLYLKTPVSDPDMNLEIATSLNLKKLADVFPMEGSSFDGILDIEAHIKGRLSSFEKEDYENVEASGWINTKNLLIRTESIKEEVRIDTAYMAISPQKFSMPILSMKLGKSDFTGNGNFENMLSYALKDDTLRGSFSLSSAYIDATELMNMMPEEEETQAVDSASTAAPAIPGNVDLTFAAKADKILYDDMELNNVQGNVILKNAVAYLNGFSMDILEGKLLMNGNYRASDLGKGLYDLDMDLKGIDAKTSFTTFNTAQSFAPIASTAQGQFSTKMKFKGELTDDLEPDLNTLQANGNLYTLGMLLQPELMGKISTILNDEKYKDIKIKDADLSFEIKDGRVQVNPLKLMMGDLNAEFSGSHGLDETMDYLLKTEVSVKSSKLPAELKALNLTDGKIPVQFKIGGTLSKPTVKPVFGDAAGLKDVVTNIVNNAVTQVKDSAVNLVNKEAERIMAEARQQADALIAQAEKQAASIKAEADKQGKNLKAEAQKQVDKLMAEAGNDPIKKLAARKAGEKVIQEADKQTNKLQAEANKQADALVNNAKVQADKIMLDAENKAKIQK